MAVNDKILNIEDKLPKIVMLMMKNLNYMVMLFVSVIMCISTYGIINDNGSKDFLMNTSKIPLAPWKIPVIVFIGMSLIIMAMSPSKKKEGSILIRISAELAITITLLYITNFVYTGLILLIFADCMRYTGKTKYTYAVLAAAFIIYLFADYNLLSGYFRLIPFSQYVAYYNNFTRGFLIGIINICRSLNSVMFIIYMIFLIRNQWIKNRQMQRLNAELNTVNEQLKAANIQLEENARTIESMTKTEERNRLAREIHDTLGHVLTSVITGIDACIELIDLAPDATKKQLEIIANVARQGMTDVRRSVKALRPDALEKMKIEEAIVKMIDEMRLSTGISINYSNSVELTNLSEDEENIIYRIIQESMTNSIRHGKASKIDISIEKENRFIAIEVIDNGIGCKNIGSGFGLKHMKERLELLDGKLSCDGSNGFMVRATLPKRLS